MVKVGAEFQVNTFTTGYQGTSAMTALSDGSPVAPTINDVTEDNNVSNEEMWAGVPIGGTAEAGSEIIIKVFSLTSPAYHEYTASATATSDGFWNHVVKEQHFSFPHGIGRIEVYAIDKAGNIGPVATHDFTMARVKPSAPEIDIISDDGIVGKEALTEGLTVSGTTDVPYLPTEVEVTFNSLTRVADVMPDGTWSVTFLPDELPLSGVHSISARTMTAAGYSVVVDTEGAAFYLEDPAAPSMDTVSGDGLVSAAEQAAGISVSGSSEAGVDVAVTLGGVTKIVTANGSGSWSASFASAEIPADGDHNVSAIATDAAGNTGSAATASYTVDTTAPTAPTINTITGDGLIDQAENNAGINVSGTAEAGALVDVTLGTSTKTVSVDDDGGWSVFFGRALIPTDGSHTATVVATDPAENTGVETSVSFTVDTHEKIEIVFDDGGTKDIGLYETRFSDEVVIDTSTLANNDNTDSPVVLLKLNGSKYDFGFATSDEIAVIDDGIKYDVIWGSGDAWSSQRFDSDGTKFGKTRVLDDTQVADLELASGRDINRDGIFGDEILEVLSTGSTGGVGLYDTAIDGLTIDIAELLVGDQSDSPLALVRSNGNPYTITPLAGDAFSVLDDGSRYDVVWGQGLDWSLQRFDADGVKVGKVRAPSAERIATLEVKFDQDINGDGTIGDEILAVLDEDALGGIGLYQTAVGGIVIDQAGLLIGDQSGSPLQLVRLNGNPYTFAFEVSDTIAVLNDGVRYNVIWGSGDNWEFQRFDTDGTKVGLRKDITQSDIYGFEEEFSQNIDDDGIIGEPVVIAILSAEISNQVAILENSFFELA